MLHFAGQCAFLFFFFFLRVKESSSSPQIIREREILSCTMTWMLKSYSAASVMNNRSILAGLARLVFWATHLQCSYAFKTKNLPFFFFFLKLLFLAFLPRGPEWSFACRAADCMFRRGLKQIISALLMINVLIFLDMVWFLVWFLIFTHDDDDDTFRSFLRRLCHIEVCVAVQRFSLHLQ